jgi:hypothetical protein
MSTILHRIMFMRKNVPRDAREWCIKKGTTTAASALQPDYLHRSGARCASN